MRNHVTASFGVFFHEIKCNGMTSFMEFMSYFPCEMKFELCISYNIFCSREHIPMTSSLHLTAIFTAFSVVLATNPFGDVRIYLGNSQPLAKCKFPFEYKGKSYDQCTWKDHMRPWCATTVTYSRDKRWGNCLFNANTTRAGGLKAL